MRGFLVFTLMLCCQIVYAMPPIPVLASKMEISAVLDQINNSTVDPMNSILSLQQLNNGDYGVTFVRPGGQQCRLEFKVSYTSAPDQEADTASPVASKVSLTTGGLPVECQ